jgi:hypothetical protein
MKEYMRNYNRERYIREYKKSKKWLF